MLRESMIGINRGASDSLW